MAATSSNGPVASKHIFINQLSKQDYNAKVRFLCCVVDYDDCTAQLMVEHNYPRNTSTESHTRAIVDVNLLLETTRVDVLQPGSWINIIGYVQYGQKAKPRRGKANEKRIGENLPKVQAILAWNAGAVQVEKYERTLEEHLSSVDM